MQRLVDPFASSQSLSQAVVEAGDTLGLERADVASIIHFLREETTALYEGRVLIESDSETWERAKRFVEFYQTLFDAMDGDQARMVRWLHARNAALGNEEPLAVLEDQDKLEKIVQVFKAQLSRV
jgi:hypothetical protein